MHLIQQSSTYSACGPFTNHGERILTFKVTCDSKYIYKNELDKTCFAHDAAYAHSKCLAKKIVSDKFLKDRAYKITLNPQYNGCKRELKSIAYRISNKKQDQE